MIKIYFKNAGMPGSAETIEYPKADGYGFKDAVWLTIKEGTETVAVIAASEIQRIEGDVGEHRASYRSQSSTETHGGYGVSPFAKPK